MKKFELISHTADLQIRVYGKTLNELFEHAVEGMFQAVGPKTTWKTCRKEGDLLLCYNFPIERDLYINNEDGGDHETLLVDFLSKLLELSDINNEAYLKALVNIESETELYATVAGVPITGFEVVEIKAVTYSQLAIKQENGIWSTDIVFDI